MSGPWSRALVTGASSGIGRAIALALAESGTPVVLVARDTARLDDLAAEVRVRHGGEAEVLSADLTDAADRARVEHRLTAEPAVDLLVNNAGFGTYGDFAGLDAGDEEREIALNVTAVVRLTRAAVPGMVARGRGWVLNVSSMASLQPTPLNATYGATKAFVTHFSESVHEELRSRGVRVTAVLPGYTRTEFQERAGLTATAGLPGFVWQSAEACAAEALAAVAAGRAVVVPGALNKVVATASAPVPRALKRRLVARMATRYKQ
jgi:short-subunit dehydrogenase